MKFRALALASFALVAAGAAHAETATPGLRAGVSLMTADGRRLGIIEDMTTGQDGAPVARLIRDDRFLYVPTATISQVDKSHFTTSLTYKQISSIR